jgi:large repetitive protein
VRVSAIFAAFVLGLLVLCGQAIADPSVPADEVGVNAQWLFPSYSQSSGVWDTQTDEMAAAGVKVVRLDAEWRRAEPDAPVDGVHSYDWSFYDAVVATLARHGIRWYPIVDYSAPWSGQTPGDWRSAPASLSEYATYARALVERYGRGGTFWAAHPELPQHPVEQWEIWNEENGDYFWGAAPDPARYADMYEQARAAIHEVDPSATVVVGGLINWSANDFLTGMFSARPDLQVDAVGLHAYSSTAAGVLGWTHSMRQTLAYLGHPDTPIEITEVGWSTQGDGQSISDAARAALITQLLPAATAERGVTRLMLHTWVSRESYDDQAEDWYGLFHPDGRPTLAGTAFVAAMNLLRGTNAPAGASPVSAPAVPLPTVAVKPATPPATARPKPKPKRKTKTTRRGVRADCSAAKAKRKSHTRASKSACAKKKSKRARR